MHEPEKLEFRNNARSHDEAAVAPRHRVACMVNKIAAGWAGIHVANPRSVLQVYDRVGKKDARVSNVSKNGKQECLAESCSLALMLPRRTCLFGEPTYLHMAENSIICVHGLMASSDITPCL